MCPKTDLTKTIFFFLLLTRSNTYSSYVSWETKCLWETLSHMPTLLRDCIWWRSIQRRHATNHHISKCTSVITFTVLWCRQAGAWDIVTKFVLCSLSYNNSPSQRSDWRYICTEMSEGVLAVITQQRQVICDERAVHLRETAATSYLYSVFSRKNK